MIRSATIGGGTMSSSLSGFFASTVTILRSSGVRDDYGEPTLTWAPLSGHVDLPAMVAGGDVSVRLKKQEFRTSQAVWEVEYRRVLITGFYATIDQGDRARFHDKDWAIVSVVIDPTNTFTELLCQSIEPGNI